MTHCNAPLDQRAALEDALNAYLDGEMGLEGQPALFGHLADCPDCRARKSPRLENTSTLPPFRSATSA